MLLEEVASGEGSNSGEGSSSGEVKLVSPRRGRETGRHRFFISYRRYIYHYDSP